jgi:ethanolamine utilization protein EutN
MRLGIVRGTVVLSIAEPSLSGKRLAIVEPVIARELAANEGKGGGKSLVVVDHLGAAEGEMVGFTEGREATNPYWPARVPVDAYCVLVVKSVDFRPPGGSPAAHGVKS